MYPCVTNIFVIYIGYQWRLNEHNCSSQTRIWCTIAPAKLWLCYLNHISMNPLTVATHKMRTHHFSFWCPGAKAQVTLCRSFFADVPDHSRPPRSVMIVTKPSDRGLNSRFLSVQDYQYDFSTTAVRHWYDGSGWSALSTFSTTISTTTDTIDTTALTMLTTTPTLLPICYYD